jgi:DNA-binding MltR family transcriptional regulator
MAKPKQMPPAELDAAFGALAEESDRGAAVLAGSMVENALGQYLEEYCCSQAGKRVAEKLFSPTGPIATFSQRSLVASGFGLISKDDHEQLDLIRDIRNHFAHHPLLASFIDQGIAAKTTKLRYYSVAATEPGLSEKEISRMGFLMTCGYFVGRFEGSPKENSDDANES